MIGFEGKETMKTINFRCSQEEVAGGFKSRGGKCCKSSARKRRFQEQGDGNRRIKLFKLETYWFRRKKHGTSEPNA